MKSSSQEVADGPVTSWSARDRSLDRELATLPWPTDALRPGFGRGRRLVDFGGSADVFGASNVGNGICGGRCAGAGTLTLYCRTIPRLPAGGGLAEVTTSDGGMPVPGGDAKTRARTGDGTGGLDGDAPSEAVDRFPAGAPLLGETLPASNFLIFDMGDACRKTKEHKLGTVGDWIADF